MYSWCWTSLEPDQQDPGNDDDDDEITALISIAANQREIPKICKIIRTLEKNEPLKGGFELVDGTLYNNNYDPMGQKWLPVIPFGL